MIHNFQNNILQAAAISCRNCHANVFPKRNTIHQENQIIIEGEWHCQQCGTFLRRGTLEIKPKPNQQ